MPTPMCSVNLIFWMTRFSVFRFKVIIPIMKIWDTIKNSKTGKYGFFVTGVDTQASLIVQGMLRYQEREVVISEAEIELSWACISMSAYSALFWGTRSKVSFFMTESILLAKFSRSSNPLNILEGGKSDVRHIGQHSKFGHPQITINNIYPYIPLANSV